MASHEFCKTQQVLLGVEDPEDGALGDPRRPRHFGRRHRRAAFDQQRDDGVEDGGAPFVRRQGPGPMRLIAHDRRL